MLPSINRTGTRAARRTWLFLVAAGALCAALPTAQTVTRPRVAGAAGLLDGADSPERGPIGSVSQRVREPSDQFKKSDTGAMVEYLPRPSKEETALQEPLDFEVIEMPFEDCVKLFAERAKIIVALDVQVLADEGFALDQPITLNLKGRRAGSVLNQLLEPFKLAFLVEDDQLKITTAVAAGERLVTRWYPVWDLPPGEANSHAEPSKGAPSAVESDAPPHISSLIRVMTTTVEQDSWEILSGPGSVAYVDEIQCLIIRQTSPVQQEVLQFLRLWREAKQMERAASAGSTRNPVGRKTKPVKSSDAENDTDKVKGKK